MVIESNFFWVSIIFFSSIALWSFALIKDFCSFCKLASCFFSFSSRVFNWASFFANCFWSWAIFLDKVSSFFSFSLRSFSWAIFASFAFFRLLFIVSLIWVIWFRWTSLVLKPKSQSLSGRRLFLPPLEVEVIPK